MLWVGVVPVKFEDGWRIELNKKFQVLRAGVIRMIDCHVVLQCYNTKFKYYLNSSMNFCHKNILLRCILSFLFK